MTHAAIYNHYVRESTSTFEETPVSTEVMGERLPHTIELSLPYLVAEQAGSPPNPASIALHERLGFRKVSHFSELGFKLGRWIDVSHWQLLL